MFKNYVLEPKLETPINLAVSKTIFTVYLIWKIISDRWDRLVHYPITDTRPAIDNLVVFYPDYILSNIYYAQWIVISFLILFAIGYRTATTAFISSFLICNLGVIRATVDTSWSTQMYFAAGLLLMLFALYADQDHVSITDIRIDIRGRKINTVYDRTQQYKSTPLTIFLLSLGLIYLGSGIGKLASGGTKWISSNNLGRHIEGTWQTGYIPQLTEWVLQNDFLLLSTAVATIIVEIFFILSIIISKKYLFSMFIIALIGFHIGIALIMGPVFIYTVVFLMLFTDWEKLYRVFKN